MSIKNITIGLLALIIIILGCGPESITPPISGFKGFVQPAHFPPSSYDFEYNEITEKKFSLGKKLFYDVRLSRDMTVSCASCHIQAAAFAHPGHAISHGVRDRLGKRNAPAIMNLAWMPHYMWDGGVVDLDLQPIIPITSHEEMDMDFAELMRFLNDDTDYKNAFDEAYGPGTVSSDKFLKALSQFMLMCVSATSKYDLYVQGQASFTEQELRGYNLFKTHCNHCHTEPLFTNNQFMNNGTTPGSVLDLGRYDVTLNDEDKYTFKVPSLRNIMITAPYMHHGQVATIEDVLAHYNSAITNHYGTVDSRLLATSPAIALTAEDKDDLIAFLRTLTDKEFVSNPLLSE